MEHKANLDAEVLGLGRQFPSIGPECVKGIEINPYAAELARITVWIGEIQWMRRNGFDLARKPILRPLDTIECRDAVLNADSAEAEWPEAEFIIGNPPFLGGSKIRGVLSDDYVEDLRDAYEGRVPGGADLVTYWFEKARSAIVKGKTKHAGLVATNSIRGGANRKVLDRINESGVIYEAWDDEPWVVEGAAVRVSLICFALKEDATRLPCRLNGKEVVSINSDLSASTSIYDIDLTRAKLLAQNKGVSFQGSQKIGPFEIEGDLARKILVLPKNPNGRPNSDVIKPSWNGLDLSRRPRDMWIIDFGTDMPEPEAALYEAPFEYVKEHVYPVRLQNNRQAYRRYWWRHGEPRIAMRASLSKITRYIATPHVAKHRILVWLPIDILPDKMLIVIAREDDTAFGILHSRFHELWALRLGTSLEDRPRYTPSTTFETFPFPEGLTPNIPAEQYADDPRAQKIAAAARRLDELRNNWLNPADLVVRMPEVVEGYPDRILPRNEAAAQILKKRTLTNLYNERPAWLDNAHRDLDEAVANAYGWQLICQMMKYYLNFWL